MTDFRRVLQNTGWTLLGNVLPIAAALLTLPFLIERLGTTRFGLLTLAWTLVGYFSLFDLGLGRALTKMVAERNGPGRAIGRGPSEIRADLETLCSTGLVLVVVLGIAGGVVGPLAIRETGIWFDEQMASARAEELRALLWVAAGIPVVVITAALRGILEGFQEFRLLAIIRAPTGVAMFVVPSIAVWFHPALDWAVAALVITRLVVLAMHWVPCARRLDLSFARVERRWMRPLVDFGGWHTVTNIVGPMLIYADRFVVGSILTSAVVAYYTVPFDVVSRVLLIPLALGGALLPALSGVKELDPANARRLSRQTQNFTLALVLSIAVVGCFVVGPAFRWWLGADFAEKSVNVARILLFGMAFSSAVQMVYAALQGYGCTRRVALFTLIHAVPYIAALIIMVRLYGIEGAAVAWTLRALLTLFVLRIMLRQEEARFARDFRGTLDADAQLRRQAI